MQRELVFMCADTGAVIGLGYAEGRRPALTRAVVFLASGETLWADGGPARGCPIRSDGRPCRPGPNGKPGYPAARVLAA